MTRTEDIKFPLYRKYKNNQRFYKIINSRKFEEIQIIGKKSIVHIVEARLLPELNFVQDLIYDYSSFAEEISEQEYYQMIPV